jgi:hypothetical protein
MNQKELEQFIKYLSKHDIVLAYWNPQLGELMPITYRAQDLIKNYQDKKPAISGKVKRSE